MNGLDVTCAQVVEGILPDARLRIPKEAKQDFMERLWQLVDEQVNFFLTSTSQLIS